MRKVRKLVMKGGGGSNTELCWRLATLCGKEWIGEINDWFNLSKLIRIIFIEFDAGLGIDGW